MARTRIGGDRLTITLGPGQREQLEAIAERHGAGLAYIIRQALDGFIEDARSGQQQLPFTRKQPQYSTASETNQSEAGIQ